MQLNVHVAALLSAGLLLALSPLRSEAATTALVIAIDTSGSIDQAEFDLQRNAYAAFFDDNAGGFAGKDVAVTVLYWGGAGVQQQVVPWTTLNSAADAQGFASAMLATTRPDISGPDAAQTGVARALTAAQALFAQQSFSGTDLVIDISGDGTENLNLVRSRCSTPSRSTCRASDPRTSTSRAPGRPSSTRGLRC